MDLKSQLKEAREAIKNKNFQKSLEICRNVLKEDKNNYLALVFLGFSIQETEPSEDGEKAFRKAIQIDPENILAWNGLANYFEKLDTTEAHVELLKIYTHLIGKETNEKKLIEYCDKLCGLYKYTNVEEICKVIYDKVEKGNYPESVQSSSRTSLINVLKQSNDLSEEVLDVYEDILKSLINNKNSVSSDYYSQYLMVLYKQRKLEQLSTHVVKMYEMFPDDLISLNWICKLYNEFYVEDKPVKIFELTQIESVYKKVLSLEPENAMAIFTRAICEVEEENYEKARESLNLVVSNRAGLIHAWILLTSVNMKLHLYKDAASSAEFLLKLLKSPKSTCDNSVRIRVEILLLEALSRSSEISDWKKAVDYFETFTNEDLKILCLQHSARANIKLGNTIDAKKSLIKLEESDTRSSTILLSQLLRKEKKYDEALRVLEMKTDETSEWFLEFGIIYLEMKEIDKCLYPCLRAAKLEPNNCYCFYYLGLCYKELNELEKSRRCFERAFKLNPNYSEAALELSKIYRISKSWDANLNLLLTLTEDYAITKQNMWAWLQLGQILMDQGKNEEAVNCLRSVITSDSNNSHCWETLADAYLAKGSYTSALKAYEKVLEISDGGALYPTLQIARIKKELGYFDDAIVDFESLLKKNKKCMLTLTGLAETCLLKAKGCYKEQRLGTTRDYAQYSVECVTCAIQQFSEISCLWKILGDCAMLVTQLPGKYSCLMILRAIDEGKDIDGDKIMNRTELFQLSAKCYSKALILAKENHLIWHDLAVCYLRHSKYVEDKEFVRALLDKSEAILRFCSSNNPNNWQHWNLLGNVALSFDQPKFALAQHCFIKAVQLDNNCAVAWTNLGVLYTLIDNLQLANQAFSNAQRSDPEYAQSWIGQGLLAEKLAQDDEAMDLFRHSTSLGFHPQGALGYGHWVCRKLLEAPQNVSLYVIKDLHAIPVACDALQWYNEKYPNDCCAWNMLGILKERMNLITGAAEAFQNSLVVAGEKYSDLAGINYARTLVRLGHYKEAVEICSDIKESSFNSGIWYALALYKDNKFQEASSIYLAIAEHLVKDKYSFGDVIACMAIITYILGEPELAKNTIVESFTQRMPTARVMYALIALGVLQKDAPLVALTLKQVEILEDVPQSVEDFVALLSYVHIYQGNYTKALRKTSNLIHLLPNKSGLWLTLAMSLLYSLKKTKTSSVNSINTAAQLALKLSENQTNSYISKIYCLISVSYRLMGDVKLAKSAAQKAIFCTPDSRDCWSVLCESLDKNNCEYFTKITDTIDFIGMRNNRIF